MKDTRFTELVNLYVDRQISPEETAELEFEIQSNPRRRQVYQQYCRMHRATKLVYESFRAHSEQTGQPVRQPASIEHIRSRQRQRRLRWTYALSGLAAAACVAFVVMRTDLVGTQSPAARNPADIQLASAPSTVAAQPSVAPATMEAARRAELPANTIGPRDYAALLVALREEDDRLLSLQNSGAVPRLNSLFDDGVFDERSVLQNRTNVVPNRKNPRTQTEFTAFQFQR